MSDMTQVTSIGTRMPKISTSRGIGLGLLALLALCALIGPDLVGKSPADQSLLNTRQGPSAEHLLGTDHLGRDMAARLLSGAQLSLSLAFFSVLTAGIPGTALGVLSAWFGGWTPGGRSMWEFRSPSGSSTSATPANAHASFLRNLLCKPPACLVNRPI